MVQKSIFLPIEALSANKALSERALAESANLSRSLIRAIKDKQSNVSLHSLTTIAKYFDLDIAVLACSVIWISHEVVCHGFDSWKIYFFNFVDEFRKTMDPRLLLLPPIEALDKKLSALLAAMVRYLCNEIDMPPPDWALLRHFLATPWFPSGIQALKATAILESPLEFRNNNIYVQKNFLDRV